LLIRTSSAGSTTGTHAFIVGVSHYPFADGPDATEWGESSGIANLTGAARSASDVAAWLLEEYNNPDAPLASVRILLSPVEEEDINPVVAALMGDASAPATRSAVETEFFDFREECRRNPQNVGFVYVAGHGVQLNKRGSVVLLQDFAIPRRDFLYGAIDMVGCHDAMDELGNAHHQLWFSDACRQHPDIARRFETLSGAYRPGEEGRGQVDSTPLFMAASTRESAFATVGGTTIFCQALLTGLRGAAATGPKPQAGIYQWHVPVTGLIEYLPAKVNALLAGIEDQHVDIAGRPCPMVAHQFDAPPEVEIVVNLEPSDAQSVAVPTLTFGSVPVNVVQSWPLRYRGSAGIYAVAVKANPPFKDGYGDFMALPPAHECKVQVT
jgi:hypothetical protein